MNKNTLIGIIAGTLILLVIVFSLFQPGEEETSEFEGFHWEETYASSDKSPYGTYVLHSLLKEEYPLLRTIRDDLMEGLPVGESDTGMIYFMAGGAHRLTAEEALHLNQFVRNGNTAFIAVRVPHQDYMTLNFEQGNWDAYSDSVTELNFYHDALQFDYRLTYLQNFIPKERNWKFIPEYAVYDQENLVRIGKNEKNDLTCLKVPYGSGEFIFNTVPLAFTNISMLDSSGIEYVERVLAHLPDKRPLFWDELTKFVRSEEDVDNDDSMSTQPAVSPLQFILDNPALRWAYYLLWITIILYVFFKGKREQRVIPPVEADKNTTMNFIDTVSELYFRQSRHIKLIRQKKKIFLNHIRNHYYLAANKLDVPFFERLSMKSGVETEKIKALFNKFATLEKRAKVTDTELIELHKMIEDFHKNSQ